MKITYRTTDLGGCTFYRAMLPMDYLYEKKLANVMRVEKGDPPTRQAIAAQGADVVLLPRLSANESNMGLLCDLKEAGKLTVLDYDDHIWKITPLSPHYKDNGTEDYWHTMQDGRRVPVWVNGVNGFDPEGNRKRLELIKQAMGLAGLVTTTTPVLAEVLGQYAEHVEVLPNVVDFRRWRRAPLRPHDDFRLFWAGGTSHFEDWQLLQNILPFVLGRFPRMTLVLVGTKFEGILKDLPPEQVEFAPWEDNLSYPLRCALLGADLGVIPLVDNEFNRCKSPIKWVEQAALEVPCICSNVTPYKELYDSTKDSGPNMVLVDNDPDCWVEAISMMVREPIVRARMGWAAYKYAKERFDLETKAEDWLRAYERHLPVGKEVLCQSS